MIREVGSEFWDVPVSNQKNRLFSAYMQWFLSGRSALKSIIEELTDCRTVAIPTWCCDSMIRPFIDAGFLIKFYPVFFHNGLQQTLRNDTDVVVLIDYFGYTSSTKTLSDYKGIVIRDVTHSVFSHTYDDADYYFGSLRKWCGVWTGGYAWTRDGHKLLNAGLDHNVYVSLRRRAMELKKEYMKGNGNKSYLNVFDEAEKCLEKVGNAPAARRDVLLAYNLDVEGIRRKRRTNAAILRQAFPEWLIFRELKDTDCPMFVPILVPEGKRDELRMYLIQNKIYCPIHWPVSYYHKLDNRTEDIYHNELSLVCDQRYTEEDMNRIVNTIKMIMEV